MRIYKEKDYKAMSRQAANIISAQVILKPDCVLGLATGSTPIGIYKQLIEWCHKGDIDFANVKTVNLDEYKGLDGSNSQSYRYFMNQHLFNQININKANTHVPNGKAIDDEVECLRYNKVIQDLGGVDLQLLGIGHNGHIGFNEPNDSFNMATHCVALKQRTIEANSRLFDSLEAVPKEAYTMGICNIMRAKMIVVVASGLDKADIIKSAFKGAVTPEIPASILQLHENVVLVADEEALSKW